MKTIKERIAEAHYEISQRRLAIRAYEQELAELNKEQAYCEHEWDSGIKGWEHEGVNCVKCGINDQFAVTLKRSYERKK